MKIVKKTSDQLKEEFQGSDKMNSTTNITLSNNINVA